MHANIVVGAKPVGGAITLDDAEVGGAIELDVAILDRVAAVAPCVVGGVAKEAVTAERTADDATGKVDVAMTNRSLATPAVASLVEYAIGVLVAAVSSLKEMELTPVLRLGWVGWVDCAFNVGVGVGIGLVVPRGEALRLLTMTEVLLDFADSSEAHLRGCCMVRDISPNAVGPFRKMTEASEIAFDARSSMPLPAASGSLACG